MSAGAGGTFAMRIAALFWKEWLELRLGWAPWLPGLVMLPVVGLPFLFTYVLPTFAGEPLEQSDFASQLGRVQQMWPELTSLSQRAAIQAFLFQQFLLLVALVPVTGAMSVAAHSIIGEKEARTLEPLLATPLTATELLLAKVLAALSPALVLEGVALAVYLGAIAITADAGVLATLISVRSLLVVLVVAPLASLVALQLVVLASTRARDPRSAQQVGVLVVLPLLGLVVGQTAAVLWVSVRSLVIAAALLFLIWLALLRLAIGLFDYERVMLRWR